jgi:hypothetical protein
MTGLKSLRSPLYILLGGEKPWARDELDQKLMLSDALPHGLKHLWLELPQHLREDPEPYFTGLYQACNLGHFPNLQSIYLHWHRPFDSTFHYTVTFLRKVNNLRDLFRACSISFDIEVILFSPDHRGTQIIQPLLM